MTLWQKALVVVAVPLVLSMTILGLLFYVNELVDAESKIETKARRVSAYLSYLESKPVYEVLNHFADDMRHVEVEWFREWSTGLIAHLADLQRLTSDEPDVSAELSPFQDKWGELKKEISKEIKPSVIRSIGLKINVEFSAAAVRILQLEEKKVEQAHRRQEQLKLVSFGLLGALLIVNVIASIIFALRFHSRTVKRLDALVGNAKALAAGTQHEPLAGSDEFVAIEKSLQSMMSALQEIRRREQMMADNVSAVVAEVNADGTFAAVSESSTRNFGVAPQQLVGMAITAESPPLRLHEQKEFVQPVGDKYFRFVMKKEERIHCVAVDVTAEVQAEQFRAEAMSVITRRLREPLEQLTAIEHDVQSYFISDPKASQLLEIAGRNSRRMIELVDDLAETELTVEMGEAEVKQLFDSAIASVLNLASARKISLNIEGDVAGLRVNCDARRITQVLTNLLGNAIKFSPDESSISLSANNEADGIRITVKDSGRGIPKDKQDLLFRSFQQVDRADKEVHGGAGLGLTICKKIVELHGGSIGFDSTVGKGTTFWFTIPHAK